MTVCVVLLDRNGLILYVLLYSFKIYAAFYCKNMYVLWLTIYGLQWTIWHTKLTFFFFMLEQKFPAGVASLVDREYPVSSQKGLKVYPFKIIICRDQKSMFLVRWACFFIFALRILFLVSGGVLIWALGICKIPPFIFSYKAIEDEQLAKSIQNESFQRPKVTVSDWGDKVVPARQAT